MFQYILNQKGDDLMGKKPKLNTLDELFAQGKDFSLSDALYKEKTGADLPKSKSYIKNSSALANYAMEKGYAIVAIEETAIIDRRIIFKKEKGK